MFLLFNKKNKMSNFTSFVTKDDLKLQEVE